MKRLSILFITVALWLSCSTHAGNEASLQQQLKQLKQQLANTYTPGFGELMGAVQVHHAKLWFAGTHQNWKLAKFEMHEIGEILEDIARFQAQREETKSLDMLQPALKEVTAAIETQNPGAFRKAYISLTNACNECHTVTHYEFIRVKTPERPPFGNQDYSGTPQ